MTEVLLTSRKTAKAFLSSNPVIAAGEGGLEIDTGLIKHGNGHTAWKDLPYHSQEVKGQAPFRGVLLTDNGSNTITLAGSNADNVIAWSTEVYDTDNLHNAPYLSRITVPAGVTKVKVKSTVDIIGGADGFVINSLFYLNGSGVLSGLNAVVKSESINTYDHAIQNISPVLNVTAGDYLEVVIRHNSTGTLQAFPQYGFFSMEIVE